MTMFLFVLVMDMPAVAANPHNRFFWALALRQLTFSGGAFAFAMPRSNARHGLLWLTRFFVGIPAMFYGVQHLLHPDNVPGIPLQRLTAEWIPGRIPLSYLVGVVLMLAGICLLTNKNTRMAATSLGLTILLAVFWIYLPMLRSAPRLGGVELLLRHADVLRSHSALGGRDAKESGCHGGRPLTARH